MRFWTAKPCCATARETFSHLLDMEEVALAGGWTPETLRLAILEGQLAAIRFARGRESFYLIHEDDLLEWIQSGLAPDPSEAAAWRAAAYRRKLILRRERTHQELLKSRSVIERVVRHLETRLRTWLGVEPRRDASE